MRTVNSSYLILIIFFLVKISEAKEIDSKTDLLQEESTDLFAEHRSLSGTKGGVGSVGKPLPGNELWPLGRNESPQIKNINVKCEKNHMKVNIEFDRPFYGMIFSKGHYSDTKCVHLAPGTGHLVTNFDIFLGACGMTSSDQAAFGTGRPGSALYIENTIIIQYDPQVQEAWDQARRLRCTWYDFYEKSVTFRPFDVDMMDAVTANFLGDNIQCWMQIQAGKGPWASEVTGIVKIGQTMTMVLAIKDDENKFDMLVRNCVAHDGKHQPIQLVDDYGCVVRPKIMSRFQKVKNFGTSATVVSYSYFQAFKFPDSMNVHFQCVIQVCRYECPEPKCAGIAGGGGGGEVFPGQVKGTEAVPASSINPRDPSLIAVSPSSSMEAEESAMMIDSLSTPMTMIDPSRMTILKIPARYQGGSVPVNPIHYPPDMFLNRQGEELPVAVTISPNENRNVTSLPGKKRNSSISAIGGSPRSVAQRSGQGQHGRLRSGHHQRVKRQALPPRYADIKTEKVIRVVAPGDVSFNLPTDDSASNSSVMDVLSGSGEFSEPVSMMCMSTTSFMVCLICLVLILCLSTIIAAFFYIRLRTYSNVNSSKTGNGSDPRVYNDFSKVSTIQKFHFPR